MKKIIKLLLVLSMFIGYIPKQEVYADELDKTIKVLSIGNSFSVDCQEYLYQVLEDLGYTDIKLGNLYIGGCTVDTHYQNIINKSKSYTYYTNTTGTWTSVKSDSVSAIESEDWDIITLQQGSPVSGLSESYSNLNALIDEVRKYNTTAKLAWNMTWAYQQTSTHTGFKNYNNDQMTMYNAIVNTVQEVVLKNDKIDFVIPTGTAIQNIRTSYIGDTLTRDGYHLSYDYGRYVGGLTFAKAITGLDISNVKYKPNGVDNDERNIAIDAINKAMNHPYEITKSAYQTFDLSNYVEVDYIATAHSFWHSTYSPNHYGLVSDASNSMYYFATQKFNKNTLPIGSILVVKEGWQYRPEGWTNKQINLTEDRPAVVQKRQAILDEDWWQDFDERAFNISKVGNTTDISNYSINQIKDVFKIYIPKEAYNNIKGKNFSILGASISTFAGTSNGIAADTTNTTIRNNAKYYPHSVVTDVKLDDTYWMQLCNDLGLNLLVNNAWSGSSLLHTRSGTVGAYVDRCLQLHDNTGENIGEEPDIIGIQMGTNDYQYYKDTLGTSDIDYSKLIIQNEDESFSYATPLTTLEAAAIMLHKIKNRYPKAEIYYLNLSQRTDYTNNDEELLKNFNSDLKKVCDYFNVYIVDIYNSGITPETFNKYIGDNKVHPNKFGMDAYTEAFKKAIIENSKYNLNAHLVSFELSNVSVDYGTDKYVVDGDSFEMSLTSNNSDELNVKVIMGNEDITSEVVSNGKITINSVKNDVTIIAKAEHISQTYYFNGTDTGLVCDNNESILKSGSVSNGQYNEVSYELEKSVVLKHDKNWIVEWKSSGSNLNSGSGVRIFTTKYNNSDNDSCFIFKGNQSGLIFIGERKNGKSHNYGIELNDYDIDTTLEHTYRLENRINEDGSNMVYLYVDNQYIGPMNNYYIGTTNNQNTTSNWLNGKDLTFNYMGSNAHGFSNCTIDYIYVVEDMETLSLKYDDYMDITGKVVEIVDAGTPTSYQVGTTNLDTSVVTIDGNYLIATGIGTAKIKIDDIFYEVTVTKAPISLFMITGHSIGAGQSGNKDESVVGEKGQVYSSHGTGNLSSTTKGVGISYSSSKKANNVNAFNEEGAGTIGEGSALAWKWNQLTGEKVWVLNTAVGGSCLYNWIPGMTNYKNAVNQFKYAQAILKNEMDAGHYELKNMGLFYHSGANFSYQKVEYTQSDLETWYEAMWDGFKSKCLIDMDSDGIKDTFDFLGFIPIWSNNNKSEYTQDRPANMWMATNKEYEDIFLVSMSSFNWRKTEDIKNHFPKITYTTQNHTPLTMPTSASEVYSSDKVHFKQVGYNAIGIDIANNLYNYLYDKQELKEFKFMYVDGITEVNDSLEINYEAETMLIPIADPIVIDDLTYKIEGPFELIYPCTIKALKNGNGKLIVSRNNEIIKEVQLTCTDAPKYIEFEGKVISILSASTSTFAGYIPVADGFNLEHRSRYPQDNLLTDVNETWWMQVINELGAKLGINDSWAGSTVSNFIDGHSGDVGEKAAMASTTRIQNLGANGTPDIIFFFGAGNDMGRGVTLGTFDPATAPTEVDLTATKWDSLADAYVAAILRLKHYYPNTKIIAMTTYAMPSYVTEAKLNKYVPTLKAICDHYDIPTIDLKYSGVTFDDLPDDIHPNAEGMDKITDYTLKELENLIEFEKGENEVVQITHELKNARASKHYYKGVSKGASFSETIEGKDVSVQVLMGDTDITNECYSNGNIEIHNVTGDIIIKATATYDCDGHLQELPDAFCGNTNIWTTLQPENIYYTVDGWGLFSNSPNVHSVTFRVNEGDRIWATSFQSAKDKGEDANGTRITWFTNEGVLKTIDRNTIYKEYSTYGYVTVPEGATAVNIPMLTNNPNREIYILNKEHSFTNYVTNYNGTKTSKCDHCDETDTIPDDYLLGDVNDDGNVNQLDRLVLSRYIAKWNDYDSINLKHADVNLDGNVNQLDRVILSRHLANWPGYETLPKK